jgi:hypothetical protein
LTKSERSGNIKERKSWRKGVRPVAYRKPKKPQRIYVKVSTAFDLSGYMQPLSITWSDGRTFRIDSVRDFYPAVIGDPRIIGQPQWNHFSDRYTVIIQGEQRYLYFERSRSDLETALGRWFVEVAG